MRSPLRSRVAVFLVSMLLVVVAGCGSSGPSGSAVSPVSEAEARTMAESMLAAFNEGDYAVWSRDWSQAMKDGIPEAAFRTFRDATLPESGKFVRIERLESKPGQNPGVTRWEATCTFEQGQWILSVAYREGSKAIEGVTLIAAP